MYNLFVSIFSIFPEAIFVYFEGLFTKIKYSKHIKKVKNELLDNPDKEIAEFAKELSVDGFCFKRFPNYILKYKNKRIDILGDKRTGYYYNRNGIDMYLKGGGQRQDVSHMFVVCL